MWQKSKDQKFIQTCYYKIKASRSLSASQHNPLLQLNLSHNCSLKHVRHVKYRRKANSQNLNKTLINQKPISQFENDQKVGNRSQLHKIMHADLKDSQLVKSKLDKAKDYAKCLKIERFKILKLSEHYNPQTTSKIFKNRQSKNLQITDQIKYLQPYTHAKQKKTLKDKFNSSVQKEKIQSYGMVWKVYPNRTLYNAKRQFNSESNLLSFRGWDSEPYQGEFENNLSYSRYHPK